MPRTLTRLPVADDGTAGLQRVADAYGDLNTLKCMLWLRDPRVGAKTVTPFRDALAVSIAYDEMRHTGDPEEALRAAAHAVGFGPRREQNFYRYVTSGESRETLMDVEPSGRTRLMRLPTQEDGIEGLRRLVGTFGKVNALQFILYMRDGTKDTVSRFRGQLALRLVDAERRADPTLDFVRARRAAAIRAGFTGTELANFKRYVTQGLEVTGRAAA